MGEGRVTIRYLVIEKEDRQEKIATDIFDLTKVLRELRQCVEDVYRRKLANAMLWISLIWFIGNALLIFLIYYLTYINST